MYKNMKNKQKEWHPATKPLKKKKKKKKKKINKDNTHMRSILKIQKPVEILILPITIELLSKYFNSISLIS
jgi:hypothetical protein